MKLPVAALAFISLLSVAAFAQKAKNYSDVTRELADKLIAAQTGSEATRLAVVPFMATRSSTQASVQFGEYLTETIIGSLSGHPLKVKLFERTRMDAVLKEQEFILTDLMKPAAALKIGQLVPIDAILSGTYTKLKSYIDVSARLIDVESGEITVSYTGRIKMNKNLAALFPEKEGTVTNNATTVTPPDVNITVNNTINTPSNSAQRSKTEICKEKVKEFSTRLQDLSTPEKIKSVAAEAMKTPFDNQCGQLHYDVMYTFTRFKIENSEYKNFILQTLDTIAFPTSDERAYEIVRFLAGDNAVDEREWQSGFRALAHVGNYSLSTYLGYLIAKPTVPDLAKKIRRTNSVMSLAVEGKIGLPRPLTFETVFFEVMEGLRDDQALRQYVYKTYASRLQLDDKAKATLFSELASMYKKEKQPAVKTEIIGWMADFVNAYDFEKAHEELYSFAFEFGPRYYDQRDEEIRQTFPDNDLQVLTARCREKFSRYALLSPYPSQKEDRINFCVKYNVPIAGVIPTLEEAGTILQGNNLDEQLRVTKLLALMGDQPKKIESSVVGLFSKRSLEDRGKMNEVQTLAIVILGNCKTSNTKAIDHIIDVLPHYGNDTEAAKEALVKIGKPAVPALISRLDKTTDQDGGLQYQLMVLLGKIGKDAALAAKSIQRVLAINKNSDVQYAGEAALQAIKY
ncbi:MAG: hypothetical protein K2U26_16240 [Cyclobacteriaceae bacterium]|nr:hypothetical protein [Cyclobacteriaceae bacterium]